MRALGWSLTLCDWCLCRKRKFRPWHVQREGDVKIQGEYGQLQARDASLTAPRRNQPGWHTGVGLLASRTASKYISVIQATQSVVLCYCHAGKLIWPGCFPLWRRRGTDPSSRYSWDKACEMSSANQKPTIHTLQPIRKAIKRAQWEVIPGCCSGDIRGYLPKSFWLWTARSAFWLFR